MFCDDVCALPELPDETEGLIAGFPCTVSMRTTALRSINHIA
jgi:hypothetical protein